MFDPFDDDASLAVNVPRVRVSLRIQGDSLDPDFITQQLGLAPAFAAAKGDAVSHGGREMPRETGIWVYRIDVPPDTELGEAIGSLLERLPEYSTLWEELTSTFQVDVFCGVFLQGHNQSTAVDAEVLGALHRRGLRLSFDLYTPLDAVPGDDPADGDD